MNKFAILLIGVLLMSSSLLNAAQGDNVFPYKTHYVTLDNGFKAILIPVDSPGLVAYYSVVRTGSRDEWEDGKSGFAHFFEHMMFRGTDRFPGNVYDSIVTSIGADANAYTSDDLTVYHLNFASEDLETVMDIESDRFRNLKYSLEQFQTESGAVYGEYRKGRTSPWSVAIEALRDLAFEKHTYKHTTIGFERDVKDMPNLYDYSISFYNRYYRPENVVLLIVGDFDVKKTETMIRRFYSPWQKGYTLPKIIPEPEQTNPKNREIQYEGRTLPLVIMSFKNDAFDPANLKSLATYPLAELAFGETSELYKKLVLNEQKVQFISPDPGMARDPYLFSVYAMVNDEKDIDYVISEINKTIKEFQLSPVTTEQLNDLISREKYSFLMSLDSPDGIASSLPQYITLTGDIKVIDQMFNNYQQITPETIMSAAKYYFTPERSTTLILRGAK